MYTNIKNLIITGISNSDIYRFAVRSAVKSTELLGGNPVIALIVEEFSQAIETVEAIFSRNLKHPLTREINIKNAERIDLFTSLRRDISSAQKRVSKPKKVMAANNLKREMKERGWWKYYHPNFNDLSATICTLVEKMAEPPFVQWVEATGVQAILEEIKTTQGEFETLTDNRLETKGSDSTPQMKEAKKNLIYVVSHFLSTIDFGVATEPETFSEISEYVNELIVEINAKTRMRKALAENSEEEPDNADIEPEGVTGMEAEEAGPEVEGEMDEISGEAA